MLYSEICSVIAKWVSIKNKKNNTNNKKVSMQHTHNIHVPGSKLKKIICRKNKLCTVKNGSNSYSLYKAPLNREHSISINLCSNK